MAAGLVEVALESAKRLRAAGLRFGVALPFWLQVQRRAERRADRRRHVGEDATVGRPPPDRSPRLRRHHELSRSHDRTERRGRDRRRSAEARRGAGQGARLSRPRDRGRQRARLVRHRRGARTDAGEDAGTRRGSRRARTDRRLPADRSPTTGRGCTSDCGFPRRSASTRRRRSARCASSPPPTAPRWPTRRPAATTAAALSLALGTLDKSGDWRGLVAAPISGEDGRRWSGFRGVSITPPTITFGGQAPGDLRREIAAAAPLVAGQPAFAGFALHDYEHLRPFLERRD